ncbi:hypothetical protein [Tepidimicrobium xylanilyticum]|uniref:Uncharacterized protein n=1 Tax=Tepidimicrobium xylanilyticum TaxID=1123352 RepID=A0A1H2WKD2_9FIRM|nr:hypothetical protein [Tepidimicrobium xylanilyticum]GMG95222.1 hypothetical protein EN5CB1_00480 [Tepidimicrobium xylanilyticum]SDW80724.1 hypothetical protein SAMN05660923_01271 [Tepidimicrobium xylanilyticum]
MKNLEEAKLFLQQYVGLIAVEEPSQCSCCCSSHGGGKARYEDGSDTEINE